MEQTSEYGILVRHQSDELASTASESPGKNHMSGIKEQGDFWTLTHQVTQEWNADKNWSSQEWKSDELMEVRTRRAVCEEPPSLSIHTTHGQIYCWQRWYEFLHRSRIRNVVRIQIILAQGEWSSAKEAEQILKKCNKRQRQTSCDIGNVYVFCIASICIHGAELLGQFAVKSKIQKISHWNRCSRDLRNWHPNNQTRSME